MTVQVGVQGCVVGTFREVGSPSDRIMEFNVPLEIQYCNCIVSLPTYRYVDQVGIVQQVPYLLSLTSSLLFD